MGTTSDEEGEPSSHTSNSDERPLKKARYIWQIKGKYHLKTPVDDEKDKLRANSAQSSAENDEYTATDNVVEVTNDEQKDNLSPKSNHDIKDVASSTTKDTDNESLYPSYEMYRLSNTISNLELTKWQDRQVARSFVDNTINGVLEVMGFTPLPFEAEDISDDDILMPQNSGNDELEDEAVLMAIHSHGLQRSEGNITNSKRKSCCNNNETLLPQCSCRQSTSIHNNESNLHLPDPFHKRPVIFSPMEVEHSVEANNHRSHVLSRECVNTSGAISISIANVNSSFEKVDVATASDLNKKFEIIPDLSAVSESVLFQSNVVKQISPSFDQNDFLDQAVAVAILKKGLSTLSGSELG